MEPTLHAPEQHLDQGVNLGEVPAEHWITVNPGDAVPVFFQDDRAVPIGAIPTDLPTSHDAPMVFYRRGIKDFDTDNGKALGVFQRAAHDVNMGFIVLNASSNYAQIVGRTVGRQNISLSVPTTFTKPDGTTATPGGVIIGPTSGEVQAFSGFQLNNGDSITISTEASLYVNLLPGQTLGVLQYIEEVNPAGGSLGAF